MASVAADRGLLMSVAYRLLGSVSESEDAVQDAFDPRTRKFRPTRVAARLPLRGAQGFMQSVLALMGLELPVPHFSTLSRRQVGLELDVPRLRSGQAIHLVVDSTGCKVHGEGE